MSRFDYFSYVMLVILSLLGILLYFSMRRNESTVKKFPRVFGLYIGISLFITLMLSRELFYPTTDLFSDVAIDFIISILMGSAAWFSMSFIEWVRKARKSKRDKRS